MSEDIDDLNVDVELEEAAPEVKPDDAPKVDPEIEADARKYGWKPKDDFTLAPEGWVDAERFLQLPQTQVKMLRDNSRNLERSLKDSEERFSKIEGMSRAAIEKVRDQERRSYEAKLSELESKKRAAVEIGDIDAYDQLSREQSGIKQPEAAEARQQEAPKIDPSVSKYMAENAWTKDPVAFRFAFNAIENAPEVKTLPAARQVQWAEKRVREFFPELFPEEKRQTARVDGGGVGFAGRGREKGADDLPAEARKQAEEYVKEGVFKNVAEYAKEYFEQEAR